MPMSAIELALCRSIEKRRAFLLDDLRLHVGLPTGLNNTPALDETRERLTTRLNALGAGTELVPGDDKPEWLNRRNERPPAHLSPATGTTRNGTPIPPTAISRRAAGKPGPRILLSGHLDTVHDPSGDFRELTIAPDGVKAVGPGCVDMKGGLVIAVAALESLHEAGINASWSFILNSDEETGSYHSDLAIQREADRHDIGLVFEPSLPDGSLVVSRPGSGQFRIEAFGKAAHVGRDFASGVSAVNALARCLITIADIPDAQRGIIANVGPIAGGHATNVVPDFACATGNVRFFTPDAERDVAAALDALATPRDAMPSIRVYRSFNRPPKPLIQATQRLADAAKAVADDLAQPMSFKSTGGVCDGNILQARGLPTIDTLGVRGGGLHTPDEWIDLRSLVERCQLLAILIARIAEGRYII
jgi:glutamate carboxypeptidase